MQPAPSRPRPPYLRRIGLVAPTVIEYNGRQEKVMTEWSQIGRLLLLLGLGLALVGGLIVLGSKLLEGYKLPWLGHLPGDIHVERKGFSCYFPLATSILVSLILTLLVNLIVRLLRRQ
jgi:hypothetical protein